MRPGWKVFGHATFKLSQLNVTEVAEFVQRNFQNLFIMAAPPGKQIPILKQDPRYFYKGTGSKRSRFLYAVSRPFICKGDNQRWQPNYSSVLGDLAAGGISNLYIPERDRHGARLTFENAGIALGTTAAINILQEFVLRRFTSKRQ